MGRRPIGLAAVAVLIAGLAGSTSAPSARAAGAACASTSAALTGHGLTAHPTVTSDGVNIVKWSGLMTSWDGLPLDVDVTLPAAGACPLPFVAFGHGWGGDKTDWERSTAAAGTGNGSRWNNVWFASRGYGVLNLSDRGWHGSCGPDASIDPLHSPLGLPAACTAGGRQYWVHLDDMRYEVRDLQWLIGRLVDAGVADPAHLGLTGGSYGGGLSWLGALANDRVMCGGTPWNPANGADPCAGAANGALVPWHSPLGVPLHISAAVPEYTWASLVNSLTPNGRASDGAPGAPATGELRTPIGIPIASYVGGLYADGYTPPAINNGFYQPPTSTDTTSDLPLWFAAIQAGVNTVAASLPGTSDIVANALDQLERYKSPLSPLLTVDARVPVMQIQGMTDPLFPPVQAELMWQKVKAADPGYPIADVFADVGHSYADNPPDAWARFNERANRFFDYELRGLGAPPAFDAETYLTRCRPGTHDAPLVAISGPTPVGMATGAVDFDAPGPQVTSNAPVGQEGPATDPIANGGVSDSVSPFGSGCRVLGTATDPGTAAWTFPVARDATLIGQPWVALHLRATGVDTELNTRLWDLSPDGKQTLMSRGTYRLGSGPYPNDVDVRFEISANGWKVPAGDHLKLEVAGADAPYYQLDTLASVVVVDGVHLHLPTADAVPAAAAPGAPAASGAVGAAGAGRGLPPTGGPGPAVGLAVLAAFVVVRRSRRSRRWAR